MPDLNLGFTKKPPKGSKRRSALSRQTLVRKHERKTGTLHEPSCENVQDLKTPYEDRKCTCNPIALK